MSEPVNAEAPCLSRSYVVDVRRTALSCVTLLIIDRLRKTISWTYRAFYGRLLRSVWRRQFTKWENLGDRTRAYYLSRGIAMAKCGVKCCTGSSVQATTLNRRTAERSIKRVLGRLAELESQGLTVLRRRDLSSVLAGDSAYGMKRTLGLLIDSGVLERVTKGVYVNRRARSKSSYLIEQIACVLRRGHFNYVSLESILSEFGVISQMMLSRLTVMTTGRSGIFHTSYGTIEFTHTKRSQESLEQRTLSVPGRPLRIATKHAGASDLRRVGRNTSMIDLEELNDPGPWAP